MLSYSWGNTVEDIIDVLQLYCLRNSLDPKRTYVWICCLCVNQHRVVENKLNGKNVPFDEFRSVFKSRVREIKNVVALLSPWREPLYLKRVWCIFELFTADKYESKLSIQMPKREEEDFKNSIYNSRSGVKINNEIYSSLADTNIEDAEASVDNDRTNIMKIVNEGCGTVELDKRVNTLLRNWINTNLIEFTDELDHDFSNQEMSERSIDEMVDTYRYVGYIFSKNQQMKMALHCYTKQRKLCEANYSPVHEKTARSYNVLGLLHKDLKEYDEAIHYHLKSISIKEEIYGTGHVETATSYFNIGRVYVEKKDYDAALNYYDKCRVINEGIYGYGHQNTASVYDAIGLIYYHKINFQTAMSFFEKSLAIYKKVYGTDHPKTTMPLSNIGLIYYNEKQKNDKALEIFLEALTIREKVLGRDHPLTIESCKQIYDVYNAKGDSVQAFGYFERVQRAHNAQVAT